MKKFLKGMVYAMKSVVIILGVSAFAIIEMVLELMYQFMSLIRHGYGAMMSAFLNWMSAICRDDTFLSNIVSMKRNRIRELNMK